MQTQLNRRGKIERFVNYQHLKFIDLKEQVRSIGLESQYPFEMLVPDYPLPEFHVSHVKHDTDQKGLEGIRRDEGFLNPFKNSDAPLVWWSLVVGRKEIQSAETRLLEKVYPDRTEQQAVEQQNFLWRFANSPAFSEKSRLGSYRFTFPLEEVLKAYSQQFCSGYQPVMRVYRTYLYTKEVVYAVLVHSPANDLYFSRFPLLRDDPNAVCVYREGCFIWRPEAMCQTHSSELIHRPDLKQMEAREVTSPVFYFWDHVALALHVENRKVLRFSAARLRQNLKFCSEDDVVLENGEDFEEAKNLVKSLWPGFRAPLEEERSLLQIYSVSAIRLVLVGRTGVGKSSSGNTILGRDAFIVGGLSGTACCCLQTEQVFGRMVTIVDTPGLLATSSTTVQWEILKSINMLTPGPHAILLVLREGSFTPQDHGTVEQMEEIFGANIWTYTIIVFIEADLKVSDPERMLSEAEPELLRRVSYRTQVLNTQPQHWDGQQVYDLVQTVVKMVVVNKGKVFSI